LSKICIGTEADFCVRNKTGVRFYFLEKLTDFTKRKRKEIRSFAKKKTFPGLGEIYVNDGIEQHTEHMLHTSYKLVFSTIKILGV